jgi:hypothetical protein
MEGRGLSKEQVIEYMEIVEKLIEESECSLTPQEPEEWAKKSKRWFNQDEGRIWTPEEIDALVEECKRMAA